MALRSGAAPPLVSRLAETARWLVAPGSGVAPPLVSQLAETARWLVALCSSAAPPLVSQLAETARWLTSGGGVPLRSALLSVPRVYA